MPPSTRDTGGTARLMLRVDFGPNRAIGPGKIRLLEAIAASGSISQAGRTLGMSYRRAWLLIDDMNHCFREPVVAAQPGGSRGGGAALTAFGRQLVGNYRAIEVAAQAAAQDRMRKIAAALRTVRPRASDKVTRMPISRGRKR
jgi:molybdate transport system regulatory protein